MIEAKEAKLIAALETYVALRETEAAWDAERLRIAGEIKAAFSAGFGGKRAKVDELLSYRRLKAEESKAAKGRLDLTVDRAAAKNERLLEYLARRAAALERILTAVGAKS